MEIITAAKQLQELLIAHDKAAKKITELDYYISQVNKQQLLSDLDIHHGSRSRGYLRLSVAKGVRVMYEQYCRRKIQHVRKLARAISVTLSADNNVVEEQTTLELEQIPIAMDTAASKYTNINRMCFRDQ